MSAAGYVTSRNLSESPDRLVSVESPVAARVQTHVTVKDGEVFRMREVKGYDVPANGSFELKPGGAHLMLIDVRRPLKEGEKVPLTLRFQRAGEVKTELQVRPLGDTSMHGMH
jgi:copper(I)-binding protein